jgi:hypothetical protein
MNDDDTTLFEKVEAGDREAVEVIYLVSNRTDDDSLWSGLDDIASWGSMTGWWNIRFVRTLKEALDEQRSSPCEVMILLGVSFEASQRIADEFPYLPQSIAKDGGFQQFPEGWPPQVVVAQWAAPRETEFGNGLETALSKPLTDLIYIANAPDLRVFSAVSEELFARIAEQPQDRFLVSPRLFEEAVAEILARMGYRVEVTPYSGDKGRDIIANLATPAAPLLMLVECKRYAPNRPVGVEPVTRLWTRLFDDKANLALVVTTSTFAPVAKEFAKTRGYQINLADGQKFIEWVRSLRSR